MGHINSVLELAERINLQGEMKEAIAKWEDIYRHEDFTKELNGLKSPDTWDGARAALKAKLGNDTDGSKILTFMLKLSVETYNELLAKGMPEEILTETFKCYTRFVHEHLESYGSIGFDRDFWTMRQASGRLFRIGELEYEMTTPFAQIANDIPDKEKKDYKKGHIISLHIPSDSDLRFEKIKESLKQAQEFFGKYYPEYKSVPYLCESWLLSESLGELLPPYSKINIFREMFSIYRADYEAEDYKEWVFKNRDINIEDAPENTTLQRAMKEYILKGGKVGVAFGRLIFTL